MPDEHGRLLDELLELRSMAVAVQRSGEVNVRTIFLRILSLVYLTECTSSSTALVRYKSQVRPLVRSRAAAGALRVRLAPRAAGSFTFQFRAGLPNGNLHAEYRYPL